jgi:tetratricopeptide (TPR) repeat protein
VGQQLAGTLAAVPLSALRAWLDGQSAYRHARYEEAVEHFSRALRADSTFVPAAISGVIAANWAGSEFAPEVMSGYMYAWRNRASLSVRDRAMVSAISSLVPPGIVDAPRGLDYVLAALDSAAAAAPENADIWHQIADELFHFGPVRMPRAEAHQRAVSAFERVLAIDSNYASAYEHLTDAAVVAGDTARARWAASRYLALDSLADHADYIRWRLATATGDSAERAALRRRMPAMTVANLERIAGTAALDGLDARDAQAAVTATVAKPTRPEAFAFTEFDHLRNRGQLDAAAEMFRGPAITRALPPGVPAELGHLIMEFGDAYDDSTAERAAVTVEAWLETPARETPFELLLRHQGACTLVQHYLSRRQYADAERMLGRLHANARRAVEKGIAGLNARREALCVSMVDAWLAVDRQAPDALTRLRHVDSLAEASYGEPGQIESAFTLARLWESLGDEQAALRAIRRRPYHWGPGMYGAAMFAREEGRIAALAGDREGAIQAYRRYLAIRVEPDARLIPEVEQVRRELARLERESAGR